MPDVSRHGLFKTNNKYKMETNQQITNFSRFYSLLKMMPGRMDREDLKEELVLNATNDRTSSLKEMSVEEYNTCCMSMANAIGYNARREEEQRQFRKHRSMVLRLLQKAGVDTTDWSAINSFCKSPKIAGKVFRDLTWDELTEVSIKLRMIIKKQNQ